MMNEKQIKKAMKESLNFLLTDLNVDQVPERNKYLLTYENYNIVITGASRFCTKPTIFFDGQEGTFLAYIGKAIGKVQESSNLIPVGSSVNYEKEYKVS
jgi:hypothetical protein